MTHARSLIAIAALAACACVASAQPTKADVKADAKAAVRSGKTAEGEKGGKAYSGPDKGEKVTSTASRTDVKRGATSAVSAPAGESKTQNTERTVPAQTK